RAALHIEQRAAIVRDVQGINAAAKSSAAAAASTTGGSVAGGSAAYAIQALSVILNGVQHRSIAQSGGFAGDEDDGLRIHRRRVALDAERHACDLARAALQTVPIDVEVLDGLRRGISTAAPAAA